MKKSVLIILLFIIFMTLSSCDFFDIYLNPFRVIYDANGADEGSIPVDDKSYNEYETTIVLDNLNNLSKKYYYFYGWNTKSDYSGTEYLPGDTITLPKGNITLYAHWDELITEVYVAGNELFVAKYWKNGNPIELTDGVYDAHAESIFVYEGDVYIAGYEYNGYYRVAKYWVVDGEGIVTEHVLPSSLNHISYAKSIFVYEGDVYIAGYEYNGYTIAVYWKNDTEEVILDGTTGNNAYAYSIFVYNNDVYVTGEHSSFAKYWKNDNEKYSLQNTTASYSVGNSIFVYDDNVYVAGRESDSGYNYANMWINDSEGNLNSSPIGTVSSDYTEAKSIYIYNNDIYVAGYNNNVDVNLAKYWKNGEIEDISDQTNNSSAYSINIYNNDVYIAGYENNVGGSPVAKYWKNGNRVELTDGTQSAHANSVFVYGRKPDTTEN